MSVDEQRIREIIKEEQQKNAQSGSPIIPYHNQDGVNSPKINSSNVIGFTPIPSSNQKFFNTFLSQYEFGFGKQLVPASSGHAAQFIDNPETNIYPIPVVVGNGVGVQSEFNGGYAPDGTVALFTTSDVSNTFLQVRYDGFWYSFASTSNSSGGLNGMQVFTSTGTFTVPAGITNFWVRGVGGGGGGSGTASSGSVGTSGGGAGYCESMIDLTGVSTVTVTIGAAGAGGAQGAHSGTDGGDTTFGAYFTAGGGKASGSNGSGTSGDVNIDGSRSDPGFVISTTAVSGKGGGSVFGMGAPYVKATAAANTDGANANVSGTGGSGGAMGSSAATSSAGGNGTSGLVIIIW